MSVNSTQNGIDSYTLVASYMYVAAAVPTALLLVASLVALLGRCVQLKSAKQVRQ